jgi:hypothetical protein
MKKNTQFLRVVCAVCFLLTAATFVSCSKDDSSGESHPPLTEFEFSGIFTGTLNNNGAISQLEGYVTIDDNGDTNLNLLTGSMQGTSVKAGENYNITVSQADGVFSSVENITGTIDVATRTLYLSGTNPNGSQMTVGGNAANPNLVTDGGWGALTKSGVTFSHHLLYCLASVTVNGVTFSGLNQFYQPEPDGLCSNYYFLHNQLRFNMEDKVSQIYCNDITLLMLNGQYETTTSCPVIQFVLDENTKYDYTVVWSDGTTGSGSFTTPDGGYTIPICLEKDGPACSEDGGLDGEDGNPRFNLQFTNSGNVDLDLYVQTPNGAIIYYANPTAQGGVIDVDCACGGNCDGENIFWENGSGPTGQYTFWVDYYGECGSGSTSSSYTVKVMNNNTVVQTKTGSLNSGESTHWTYNHN